VIFDIPGKLNFSFPDPKSEELDSFKDVEVAFKESKYSS
jgi:hypothetical protein